jgi:hypothetical protein
MSLDSESEVFWNDSDLEGELKRVFDICNGCRRCDNLCLSFNGTFDRLDRGEVEGDCSLAGLQSSREFEQSRFIPSKFWRWPTA